MPSRFIVMYPLPTDTKTFDHRYATEHLPLAQKSFVKATGLVLTSPKARPDGGAPQYYQIAAVSYASEADMLSDLSSVGGKATAANAVEISSGGPPVFLLCEDLSGAM